MKITLEDFPDNVYVLLDDMFRAKFFKSAWKIVGGYRKLAKIMGVSAPTMLAWRRGKDGKHLPRFCSVKNIKIISKLLVKNGFAEFNLDETQKRIEAYRARAGKLWVCNPRLPIKDCIELREIVTHLLCDGSAQLTPHRTSKYCSTSFEACQKFLQELNVFGDILRNGKEKIKVHHENYKTKSGKDVYVSPMPKAISNILINKFKISFNTFEGRIPKEFFNAERLFLVSIMRAFLIDEGTIQDTRVSFRSANFNLLNDLKSISTILGYKYDEIRKENRTYNLSLSKNSVKQFFKDIMKIGPLSIISKQNLLELAVYFLSKNYNIGSDTLDEKILKLLSQKHMTIPQISRSLRVRQSTLRKRFNRLKKHNKILVIKKLRGKGGGNLWSLA